MEQKPKLIYEEPIQHLAEKGITFSEYTKEKAIHYLAQNNNLFKLSSYRKNYNKDITGQRYLHLDFGELVDLAIIDMYLRQLILKMALNIEHFAKVKLLRIATMLPEEDGYTIVQDYLDSLPPERLNYLASELSRNAKSPYCAEVYEKYKTHLPVWVFVEIISFGSFISFYRFCARRWQNASKDFPHPLLRQEINPMMDESYLFLSIKTIRNAAAHNNCILNDLKEKSATVKINRTIHRELKKLNISDKRIDHKMSNQRISQIVSCLYVHKILSSKEIQSKISIDLQIFRQRLFKRHTFIKNRLIKSSFDFFTTVIDSWYPII